MLVIEGETRGPADTVAHIVRRAGVTVRTGEQLTGVHESSVQTTAGEIPADLVVLGLGVEPCIEVLRPIVAAGGRHGIFVRVDMENSPYTEVTLEIFQTLWRHGYRQIGVVLQSALHRSEEDLRVVNALGGRVRLVKGAYDEPDEVAKLRGKSPEEVSVPGMLRAYRERQAPKRDVVLVTGNGGIMSEQVALVLGGD